MRKLLPLLAFALLPAVAAGAATPAPAPAVNFNRDVRPILSENCFPCHGTDEKRRKAGLRLDEQVSDKVAQDIVRRLKATDDDRMPPPKSGKVLKPAQIGTLENWVRQGAKYTAHWAYVKPLRPATPAVTFKSWPANPIDNFVLARLEHEGLRPSPAADRYTLIRRVSLDLTGLPPSVAEVDAFANDRSPSAYEKVVDRLLASPHYGERMARPWLDLARYADTNGYEKDLPRQMWLYRDWLIDAFNRNMPFDEFTTEQIAGDLLPNPTPQQLIATGFNRNTMLNDEGGIDAEEFRVVAVMDRVDATATTWLGTTMACAQCHTHKYDPISHTDYYRFYALLNNTQDNGRDPAPVLKVPSPEQTAKLTEIKQNLAGTEKALNDPSPELVREQAEWEKRSTATTRWTVLDPTEFNSSAGSKVTKLADKSLLASGLNPDKDAFVVKATCDLPGITGFRLEALPDPSLVANGPGRADNGNFVLSEFKVESDAAGTAVPLKAATAAYGQDQFPVANAIDGKLDTGWAIMPQFGKPHVATFEAATAVAGNGPHNLTFRLYFNTIHRQHVLGHFRLSVTNDPVATAPALPDNIRAILETAGAQRTPAQQTELATYYRSQAPSLQPLRDKLTALKQAQIDLENAIPATMVMREGDKPRDTHRLNRGDFRQPAEPVQPGVPLAFHPLRAGLPANRLGLAKWLTDRDNPLVARVTVNRFWELCFGRGIVTTAEDFGTQGEPPTHPELLDWLATEFMEHWDMKALMKRIVMSSTYRQSSTANAELLARDPNNTLLARGPRFRAEAEMVRDIALTAGGRLTPIIGGPSVMPPQPPGIWENSFSFYDTKERWVDETGPNRYRRGIYTYWRRTAAFPSALTFDTNMRDVCSAKRGRTNTPLQALNTLNDAIFIESAGGLAQRMLTQGGASPAERASYGLRVCVARPPHAAELKSLTALYDKSLARFSRDAAAAKALLAQCKVQAKSGDEATLAALTVVANVLLNMDETITKG